MKTALLIYNEQAGVAHQESHSDDIQAILNTHGFSVTFASTKGEGDAETMCKKHGSSYAFIFIYGGDGTVHECINGLADFASPSNDRHFAGRDGK